MKTSRKDNRKSLSYLPWPSLRAGFRPFRPGVGERRPSIVRVRREAEEEGDGGVWRRDVQTAQV